MPFKNISIDSFYMYKASLDGETITPLCKVEDIKTYVDSDYSNETDNATYAVINRDKEVSFSGTITYPVGRNKLKSLWSLLEYGWKCKGPVRKRLLMKENKRRSKNRGN